MQRYVSTAGSKIQWVTEDYNVSVSIKFLFYEDYKCKITKKKNKLKYNTRKLWI